ncbi:hypothetical protein CW304_13445 [Bacillus sp. UFRGS-B20]|nr:hypothetical protein CW304_13445 [Bacillus sp. UFRGS-B20]
MLILPKSHACNIPSFSLTVQRIRFTKFFTALYFTVQADNQFVLVCSCSLVLNMIKTSIYIDASTIIQVKLSCCLFSVLQNTKWMK